MENYEVDKLGVAQAIFRKKVQKGILLRKIKSFILWASVTVIIVLAVFMACFQISYCTDDAMGNLIKQGNIVITNRLAFLINGPERGELISFRIRDSSGKTKILQRRLIAYQGEKVMISNSQLYVDNMLCDESYVVGSTDSELRTVNVPEGTYYVLSDVREIGPDSRNDIYIAQKDIVGSVFCNFYLPTSLEEAAKLFYSNLLDKVQ